MIVGTIIEIDAELATEESIKKLTPISNRKIENGKVLLNPKVKVGLSADNFARNLISIIITWTAYKKPRIVKR